MRRGFRSPSSLRSQPVCREAGGPVSSPHSDARSGSSRTCWRRFWVWRRWHTSALAFQLLKFLGVAYLFYTAWSTLKQQGALKVEAEVGAHSATQVVVSAILVNILNPKLSIFLLAFLPQFVSPTNRSRFRACWS